VLVAGIAGCTGADPGASAPSSEAAAAASESQSPQPTSSATAASAEAPATVQPEPDPATARLSETVGNALRGVAAANPKPGQEQLTAALTGAGIPAGSLQVSASRTPTGLEVDAIEAAALQGKDCVIGQIRDGNVVVTVLPVLATGKCFVGG
jgi:pyruvate/2-oxoglutarate dehydrogenase complex dihydrolipoamide acyltransferase (E2) component